jgi:hypothetical protein
LSSIKILPHVCIDATVSEAVELGTWFYNEVELERVDLTTRPHFDPAMSCELQRDIRIFPIKVAVECEQGAKSSFAVSLEVRSTQTGLRHFKTFETFSATGPEEDFSYSIDLRNWDLGGRLLLSTRLLLINPDPKNDLAASQRGSIVYSETCIVDLEEHFDGFPHLEPAKLSSVFGLKPGPNWIVEVDTSDMHVHATQALVVHLNSESNFGIELLKGKRESESLRRAIRCDITRAMVNAAIDSELFEQLCPSLGSRAFKDYPNSIGAYLLGTLTLCGFTGDLSSVRAMREQSPTEFEAHIHNLAYS